jgi:hypothetical protein
LTTLHIGDDTWSSYLIEISTKKISSDLYVCLLLQASLAPAVVGVCCFRRSVNSVGCCQHHCFAGIVAGVSTVACVPALTGVLLLLVSLFVPGVGITSIPIIPAAADVPAVTCMPLLCPCC